MLEYRWKVTWLSEGMLIWNCQQLFWRIRWLLWSLHPAECPNFDTESHGCGYLYILWENRFPPRNGFFPFFLRLSQGFSCTTETGGEVTDARKMYIAASPCRLCCFNVILHCCCWLFFLCPCSKVPGSQSESPNQCISYNSHSPLILPLKFMLLFSGTPCCGPHCLPNGSFTVTQECWARCRVIPSDAPPLPKATSIAATGQSARPHWNTTHQNLNHTASPALPLAGFFFFFIFYYSINNSKCKS